MADQIVKPNYTPTQSAWIAAYVATHGPIHITVGEHPATVAANGWITVSDASQVVESTLMVEITNAAQALVKDSALAWVDVWIARGYV